VRSAERLLDEARMFLHRRVEDPRRGTRPLLERLHRGGHGADREEGADRRRRHPQIFAMTSMLEPHQMNDLSAETGRGAIETLQRDAEIDIVLMDIMMPGHGRLRHDAAIRKLAKFPQPAASSR
jgi:CheY-like chemotaxis protein